MINCEVTERLRVIWVVRVIYVIKVGRVIRVLG